MKNKTFYLVVGQFSLAIGLILNHFFNENEVISFVIGLLTSLSLVLNTAFLLTYKKGQVNEQKI